MKKKGEKKLIFEILKESTKFRGGEEKVLITISFV